jgi:hypothetical protein
MPRSASAWCSSSRSWPDSVTPFGPAEYHHIVAGRAGTSRETHYVQIYALTFESLLIVSPTQAFCLGVGCGPRAHPAADQKGNPPLPTPPALPTPSPYQHAYTATAQQQTEHHISSWAEGRRLVVLKPRPAASRRRDACAPGMPSAIATPDFTPVAAAHLVPALSDAAPGMPVFPDFGTRRQSPCRRRTLRAPRPSARGDRTG